MDTISKEKRSLVMAQVRSRDTKFENSVTRALKKLGKSFKQQAKLIGKPDIVSRPKKVVIFLDSCFWHGCRWHCRVPKSRLDYWKPKIQRNKERAKIVNKTLRSEGWEVARFWEHQFNKDFESTLLKVSKLL